MQPCSQISASESPEGLSVSSVGSEAMQQPRTRLAATSSPTSFSILGRIGGDATLFVGKDIAGCRGLSVSSVGSEAMQLSPALPGQERRAAFSILGRIGGDATIIFARRGPYPRIFQYPRSDRRRCNDSLPALIP